VALTQIQVGLNLINSAVPDRGLPAGGDAAALG